MTKIAVGVALLLRLLSTLPVEAVSAQSPEQAERGKKAFAQRNCTACHRFEGQGTAVGPDLSAVAHLSPKAISMAILATRTAHVVSIKLKSGETFPAMRTTPGKMDQVYDLAKDPPALRKLEEPEIEATKDNETWKHPPLTAEIKREELADLIAYLRWIAVRDRKGVDPAEL